jgi:hypothetical protein
MSFEAEPPRPGWYYLRNSKITDHESGGVVLQKAHAEAAFCHQRAEENRRMAEQAGDPALKEIYLDLERRWERLALSYADSEQYIRFTAQLACTLDEIKIKEMPGTR